jgi:hypothetical protein
MTDVWLRATVRWCLRLFTLLLLLCAGRLGLVAYRQPTVRVVYTPIRSEATREHQPAADIPLGLEALRKGLTPAIPSDLLHETASSSVAGGTARPIRRRVYLVVNVSPDRSELLVNGVTQGQTPYVGEIGCQSGGSISITVVPPKGMPKRFERECDRREIRVEE